MFGKKTDSKNTKSAAADNKKKQDKAVKKIRRTVQESIPYDSVYPNGIIQNGNTYCKSYRLDDTNFTTANQSEQENIYLNYEGLLNSINDNMIAKTTIFNRSIDMNLVRNQVLLRPQNDSLNDLRNEYNNMLIEKMQEGRNNLEKEKFFTVALKADSIEDATVAFYQVDHNVSDKVNRINQKNTVPMTIEDRLNVLYDIYNDSRSFSFSQKVSGITNEDGKIDLAALNRAGLRTKDIIGPDSFTFKSTYFMIGEKYAKAFFFDNLPSFMNADILNLLSGIPCEMLASVVYRPIPMKQASTLVRQKLTGIHEEVIKRQKDAAKNNYSADIMPTEIKRAREEAEALRKDMQTRNQKLFYITVSLVIMADSEEELAQNAESLRSVGMSSLAQVRLLSWQQERAFNAALPLGEFQLEVDRVLTTESSAVFMPFAVRELSQTDGTYYGLNAISHNLILYNRLSGENYNGLIFGQPGSGKSFAAKSEMAAVRMRTDDDIFVIDPEGEYRALCESFGGETIRIAVNSDTHINPLDMDIQYAGTTEDPIAMKCDFLTSLCETILGGGTLSPLAKNVIHRCGRQIYRPYYETINKRGEQLKEGEEAISCDYTIMPTLVDFYLALKEQGRMDTQEAQAAQILASSVEMYCTGNYDIFAKHTDINPKANFIVYDIKDLPNNIKELALQICLNDVWNRIIENKRKGKRTWFYIDEFHLLLQTKSSAQFVLQIYKRARKWGGIPTGITQNVEDILNNNDARLILNNSEFVIMMNQSQMDRATLAGIYNISDTLLDYITDKPTGTGLIRADKTIVPFTNQFPKDTKLYKIMSTKATEEDVAFNNTLGLL